MHISIGILLMELEKQGNFDTNIQIPKDFPIKNFQIWDESKMEYDILYIVSESELKSNPGIWSNYFLIGYDTDSDTMKSTGSQWITFKYKCSLSAIINKLQIIFQEFNHWVNRVEEMSHNSTAIEPILKDLENTYSLMSMLVTKNLKYLAASPSFADYNPWIANKKYMPLDLFNDLLADEEFRNAQNYDEAFLYYSTLNESDSYSYCYNIKKENVYRARLLVHCKSYLKNYGIMYITEFLGKKLSTMMDNHSMTDDSLYTNIAFKELVANMLKGIHKNSIEIKECLKELKWEQKHTYQVYVFELLRDEIPNTTHEYYQTQLVQFLGECYVIEENSKFICLINLTLTPEYKHNDRQSLSIFLRDNLCKVGISNVFYNLSDLSEYYKEADIALFIGNNYMSTKWVYHFSDSILPYFKHQMTKDINAEHLLHPAIKILQEYDNRENTQLLKTVETLIQNKYNITHTAEKLFIHRTSLLVRLDRIRQLTGVNFENYEERVHLVLSFMLL